MDDLVQAVHAKQDASQLKKTENKLAVAFKKETDSCSIVEASPEESEEEAEPGAMGAQDSDNIGDDSKAVLLQQDMKKSQMQVLFPRVYLFFSSYRSGNPEERVTPFALVLLLVLFLIYVLNQADRLVLAVTIPAGLRCELKASECGVNTSINSSLMLGLGDSVEGDDVTVSNLFQGSNGSGSSNTTNEDCIHFSDSQQGLLTGAYVHV
jgi:hypothetical protein